MGSSFVPRPFNTPVCDHLKQKACSISGHSDKRSHSQVTVINSLIPMQATGGQETQGGCGQETKSGCGRETKKVGVAKKHKVGVGEE